MAGRWDDDDEWGRPSGSGRFTRYEFTRRIPVEGGLVHSKARGAMAESWWSQRFVAVLESYGLGGRMQRGRTYARKGQVVSLDVEPGVLYAAVQGSRPRPYQVMVAFPPPSDAKWTRIEESLGASVGYVARLTAGEVPEDLETVFDDVGAALFPRNWGDMRTDCSCPDWGDPCKHIAAALYLFADQLDRDPWLLLAWRGRTRDEILAPLRARAAAGSPSDATAAHHHDLPPWWPLVPDRIEAAAALPPSGALDEVVETPDPPERVLDRLDDLDLAVRGTPVVDLLAPIYRALVDRP